MNHSATSALNLLTKVPFRARVLLIASVACLVALTYLVIPQAYRALDLSLDGLSWRQLSVETTVPSAVIVAIDEKSLDEIGAWPWPRSTLAELSDALAAYGVTQQLFDVVFPEARPGDEQFARSLIENRAVIGHLPFANGEAATRKGVLSGALSALECGLATAPASGFLGNTESLAEVRAGHIAPVLEPNGAIMRVPALMCVDGLVYPALSLAGFVAGSDGAVEISLERGAGPFGAAYYLIGKSENKEKLTLPLDENGLMAVDYRHLPGAFSRLSAVDVLKGRIPSSRLQGRSAIVGATAFGLGDIVPTPFTAAAPGVEIQARLFASLWNEGKFYTPAAETLFLLLLGGLGTLLVVGAAPLLSRSGSVLLYPALALVTPAVLYGVKLLVQSRYSLILPVAPAIVYTTILALVVSTFEHYLTRRGSKRLLKNFTAYLPAGVAEQVGFELPKGYVEAERQRRVLLNADLRNFTAFEDVRPPEETAALLHLFLVEATAIADRTGGVVEELNGDSIIISWGLADGYRALQASRDLHGRITSLLQGFESSCTAPMALGIGIEAGLVFVGSLGPESRRVHTLLGDAVSRVVRIQEMTEELAQPILVGDEFVQHFSDEGLELQGSFLLSGLSKPRRIYTLSSRINDSWEQLDNHLRLVRTN